MISVCIASYNGADYILDQLKSILPQLRANDEIIVSDDHSTDGTPDLVRSLNDSRIRLVEGPCKGSPIPNFEYALSLAQGDYIFLSDQDDCWMPNKVATSIEALKKGYDLVITDCQVTDKNLNVYAPSFFTLNKTRQGKYYNLYIKNGYLGGCMAFSKRLRDAALPFPTDIPMHDIWIGNVAAFYFNVLFINQTCSYFRRTGNNVSTSAGKSKNSLSTKIAIRLKGTRQLLQIKKRVKRLKKSDI